MTYDYFTFLGVAMGSPHYMAPEQSESLDADPATGLDHADASFTVPDTHFDRQWALSLIERALESVRAEFEQAGKLPHFETFKPWLVGDCETLSQSDVARSLGMTGGAVKVAIHHRRNNSARPCATKSARP